MILSLKYYVTYYFFQLCSLWHCREDTWVERSSLYYLEEGGIRRGTPLHTDYPHVRAIGLNGCRRQQAGRAQKAKWAAASTAAASSIFAIYLDGRRWNMSFNLCNLQTYIFFKVFFGNLLIYSCCFVTGAIMYFFNKHPTYTDWTFHWYTCSVLMLLCM